jgi:membrane protease YdiL (CAAX protease family)
VAWWAVARFGISVALLSVALSGIALLTAHLVAVPWAGLSWWTVTRRCVSMAAALSLWWCIRYAERRSLGSYGLGPLRAGKRDLARGLALGAGTLVVLLGLGLAVGLVRLQITPDQGKLWRTVIGFLPAAGVVGLLEELVFRGFLLRHLLACSTAVAVLASSACYALVHLKHPAMDWAVGRELIGLGVLGAVLAMTVLRTRTLYLAIGLHASLAYGVRVNKLLLEFPEPSLCWLTGTTRLVNGLLSWLALLGIGGIVLWWTRPSSQRGGSCHGEG